MDLSIVVPLFNERDNLAPLHRELTQVLEPLDINPTRFCFVDDGSSDGSDAVLRELAADDAHVRVIRLARNSGQTAALSLRLPAYAWRRGGRDRRRRRE